MTELDMLVEMILKYPNKITGDYTITIPKKNDAVSSDGTGTNTQKRKAPTPKGIISHLPQVQNSI